MKRRRIISLIVAAVLVLSSFAFANAEGWEDFTDISGHWAEATMKRAYEDKLVTGYGEGIIAPDENITIAQMTTILTRVLGATQSTDPGAMGIGSDEWYYEAAGKALYLGLIDTSMTNLDAPMLRQDAMGMMAKAFSLIPAMPEYSVLDSFSDGADVSAKNRAAMAALVSEGFVQGASGSLMANSNITRAEFVTALYRVAENYLSNPSQLSGVKGGSVVAGGNLMAQSLPGRVWLDCTTSNVSLLGVTGNTLTLRAHNLSAFNLGSGTELNTLVVDCGTCKLDPGTMSSVSLKTLRLVSGGSMTLTDSVIANVEITGNFQTAVIGGEHDRLVISGDNNTVTLSEGAVIGEIVITGRNNTVTGADQQCTMLTVEGSGNKLTVGGNVSGSLYIGGSGNEIALSDGAKTAELALEGEKNTVSLGVDSEVDIAAVSGESNALTGEVGVTVDILKVSGKNNKAAVTGVLKGSFAVDGDTNNVAITSTEPMMAGTVKGYASWVNLNCENIAGVDIDGSYHTVVKDGGGDIGSVTIPGNNNTLIIQAENALFDSTITGNENRITADGTINKMTIEGRKTVVNGSGRADVITVNGKSSVISIPVTNLVDNGVSQEEIDRVLDMVSYRYVGNYTLQWAQQHDYSEDEKEIWVNAKNYSSKTDFLIWVNLSMQRVNIFKGTQGEWELIRSSIVGTGAPGSGTPVGVYYTTYKQAAGWTTGSYTCKPVVGFKVNTGYAFHSRLYYPNSSKLKDPSIGFPVSAGCVRMYDEDIQYIFDNIPLNTTVVVH